MCEIFKMGPRLEPSFNAHQYAHAASCLRDGAIGIGEDHRIRFARDFAVGLIERGHVRNLFLECNSSAQEELDKAVNSPTSPSEYQKVIEDIVDSNGPQFPGNEVELGQVATAALKYDAKVHLIDLNGNKSTKASMLPREAHAANLFDQITAQEGRAGSLVLYGAVHLTGDKQRHGGNLDASLGRRLGLTSFIITEIDTALVRKRP